MANMQEVEYKLAEDGYRLATMIERRAYFLEIMKERDDKKIITKLHKHKRKERKIKNEFGLKGLFHIVPKWFRIMESLEKEGWTIADNESFGLFLYSLKIFGDESLLREREEILSRLNLPNIKIVPIGFLEAWFESRNC